jgi:hypothetical protein
MKQTVLKGRAFGWASGFFAYGTVVHLLLFRYFVRWAYSGASDTTFVNHPLTNIAMPILGGICVSLLMLRLLNKASERDNMTASRIVFEAGLRGMGATVLALELFYILASAYLAVFLSEVDAASHPPLLGRIAGAFILWFISIQTYGLQPVALSLPFSFVYGCVAAVPILRATNKRFGRTAGS